MRRKRIHVSSGTYCRALAQLERRMMLQMDLTNADSERVPAIPLGALFFGAFLPLAMTNFLFLIDQSGSMNDVFGVGEGNQKKADGVADAINRMLQNLVIKCAKEDGVRDYFHVGVIGYGAQVGPAFSGPLAGRQLVPLSEVGNSPARVEQRNKSVPDGAGGVVEQSVRFPVWFEAVATGGTPVTNSVRKSPPDIADVSS
jgi:hypothetical protein